MQIELREGRVPRIEQALALYHSVGWSSASKPEALMGALRGSHTLVTAWQGDALVGLGNAISDGHLVVYYANLLVRPELQGRGIGSSLMRMMMRKYVGFHQQVLLSDGEATAFHERFGFKRSGSTVPMWIYDGPDHA